MMQQMLSLCLLASCLLSRDAYVFPPSFIYKGAFSTTELAMSPYSISSAKVYTKDLSKTTSFYTDVLGLSTSKTQDGAVALQLGNTCTVELHQLPDTVLDPLVAEGFVGFGVSKPASACTETMSKVETTSSSTGSVEVTMPLGDYKYHASMVPDEDDMGYNKVRYAQLTDENGYKIEVKEQKDDTDTVSKIIMNVIDLDESIEFYTKVLGMTLFRHRSDVFSDPKRAAMVAYVGFADSEKASDSLFLELNYNYSTEKIKHGSGFEGLTVRMPDMASVLQTLTDENVAYKLGAGSAEIEDPNGYKLKISFL